LEERAPRVLIVDDDEDVRHALRLLFETEGFEITGEAANGVEAVIFAVDQPPDIVVLDYFMPRLDGEGAAQLLRALAPGAKIVAFSAVIDSQPIWADAYLNKDRITEIAPFISAIVPEPGLVGS
jgi:CheY-like chemotaxis protein